jgi:hypothetical protein
MCMYLCMYEQKCPFSPIFPDEGGRRSLRNLALCLGWPPDMLPQIVDLKSLSFKFFLLCYLSLVTGPPTTPDFTMPPTPSIPALWRICRLMWEEENLQFFGTEIPSCSYQGICCMCGSIIIAISDEWHAFTSISVICLLFFGKRSGLMRRKSRCQLWNRPQMHETCLPTMSGGTNLLSLRSVSVVCALHIIIGYVERTRSICLKIWVAPYFALNFSWILTFWRKMCVLFTVCIAWYHQCWYF